MDFGKHIESLSLNLRIMNYSENTIESYCSCVKIFLEYFNIRPKDINENQIKTYLEKLQSTSLIKQNIGALKLFYKHVIKQPLKFKNIQYPRKESRLPVIYSQEEMKRLISVIENKKHLAIVMLSQV